MHLAKLMGSSNRRLNGRSIQPHGRMLHGPLRGRQQMPNALGGQCRFMRSLCGIVHAVQQTFHDDLPEWRRQANGDILLLLLSFAQFQGIGQDMKS